MRDPAADIEANVIGSVHVGEAAAAVGARRLVFVSTGGALYGEPEQVPVTEEATPNPASVYGTSKLAAEQYLRLICERGGVELSIVRPGNVYGPAQDPDGEAGAVAIFVAKMLRGEPVTIFGDGSQQRDYVYVADLVDTLVHAGAGAPATCLIGTGVLTSTREIFEQLATLIGYEREPLRAPERPGDIQRIAFDASQARELWEWAPTTPLRDGLAQTVEWFRRSTEP
jgi:nucleoside-diphosphate-sugar epimerase